MIMAEPARLLADPDTERAAEIRRKAGRFRILIIGKANAGKTTILRKVCHTTDDPEIYDAEGELV